MEEILTKIVEDPLPELTEIYAEFKVPIESYDEILALLNGTDYINKKVSIKRKETRFYYPEGHSVILEYRFPLASLRFGRVVIGDGQQHNESVRFSENISQNKGIKSRLLEMLNNNKEFYWKVYRG